MPADRNVSIHYDMGFSGCLEPIRYRTVGDWAHETGQSRPPVVRIQVNGADAGIAVADLPRPDLLEMGIASFDRGFEWSISARVADSIDLRVVISEAARRKLLD